MRLALLADLHFGRVEPELADTLVASLTDARPDLILVAGDFVQRARASHFRLADAFLRALPAPWRAVPGNHDLPLWNLPARALAPRAAYRRWIDRQTEFRAETDAVLLIGLDTTARWQHQRGRVDAGQIARVAEGIRGAGGRMPIVLAHHPFHQSEAIEKKLMIGAGRALEVWAECGPHVVMTGHLHQFLVEPFLSRRAGGQALQIHCGTSTSTRHRGAPNDYALVDVSGRDLRIERRAFAPGAGFEAAAEYRYAASPDGWHDG
jgi:3',5'-cyclic AMP phosphodiesterase CpdA